MPVPRFEVPSGAVDGVNTVYTVSVPYQGGSTAVFINGLLMERTLDDGWTETDPGAGTVTLKEAPRSIGACPDVIQVFFLDTSPVLPESVVERLRGRLRLVHSLEARLVQVVPFRGVLEPLEPLMGRVAAVSPIRGVVEDVQPLRGRLKAVC